MLQAKRAVQLGATAVIFDVTHYTDAIEEVSIACIFLKPLYTVGNLKKKYMITVLQKT